MRRSAVHIEARFGFQDEQDLPDKLRRAVSTSAELDFDPEQARCFPSCMTIQYAAAARRCWLRRLITGLAHNAANLAVNFGRSGDRTVIMGASVEQ